MQAKETNTTPQTAAQANKPADNGNSMMNMKFVFKTLLLHWPWFVLSAILCLGLAYFYVRYTAPVYQVSAEILIKDDQNMPRRASNKIQAAESLGLMSNTEGFDNEMELLKSVSISEQAVRDLKLYVDYKREGSVTDIAMYKETPIVVDMDEQHLNDLKGGIALEITRNGEKYSVSGKHTIKKEIQLEFSKEGPLPLTIATASGTITISSNPETIAQWDGSYKVAVSIQNPSDVGAAYAKGLSVSALSKTTTIASLVRSDILPDRGKDYLKQIAIVYNRQANEDKNQIAVRTEKFINERLEKINIELGATDGAIEDFKRRNNVTDLHTMASRTVANSDETDKKLAEMQTQVMLMQSIKDYMRMPENKYQALPSNVGLTDASATSLIAQYNNIAMRRNHLMQSGSEINPNVEPLTQQLDDLTASINRSIDQSMKNLMIQQNSIISQLGKYNGELSQAPQQERYLTEIGRQQEVKSSLYIMLLQKREENSIDLAATADKGRLIDEPVITGPISPKKAMIMLMALILGLAIPLGIYMLIEMLRYRIEGREDVEKLTDRPIIADVAIANDKIKTKGDIVVKENNNSHMEEIFRGMRTNIQFTLKENENVIMFTSSTSGEGKTFVAANLAVSFATLGKKVILVGLDIRRPRLASLFEIDNDVNGVSLILTKDKPTLEDIQEQIVPSGIRDNLDILMAGTIPPNPAELVSRSSLDEIFAILRKEYDYVIVDTAPVGLVSDTLQLGRIADSTIYICRADYTERAAFQMLNDLVEQEKLPNVSIVINGIDMRKKKHSYAYGYGKYGRYGKYGKYGSTYGSYGAYSSSHYGNPNDNSIKK